MRGNLHVRFGPGAVGEGPVHGRHLANGPPVPRAVVAHRWGWAEDTVHLAEALKPGLAANGVPEKIYVDYADPRVMPTRLRSPGSAGIGQLRKSA